MPICRDRRPLAAEIPIARFQEKDNPGIPRRLATTPTPNKLAKGIYGSRQTGRPTAAPLRGDSALRQSTKARIGLGPPDFGSSPPKGNDGRRW